ncbi:MAG: FAD-dependent oxidoreductase [Clostridiaceae bacterium]|nr:FAD-dependent oxidoreductase [Clostridiaceae bacterium]
MSIETVSYRKELQVKDQYDVVVVGSGPSGICAAVSAARMGARTALVERYGVLGGNLTVGAVAPILGSVSKGTMRDELVERLGVPGCDEIGATQQCHDFEKAKRVLADFAHEAGVSIYLQTPVVDVIMDGNRVDGVVVSGKTGLKVLRAKTFVDASGDGDVAYYAGAEYQMGRDGDSLVQPVTLMFTLHGVEEDALTCIGEVDHVRYKGERFLDYTTRLCKEGYLPPNAASVRLFRTKVPGERVVNTTQANGIFAVNSEDVAKAEVDLRNQIDMVVEFLRRFVDGYQNCYVKSTAETLGVRETRRFIGEYILEDSDLRTGRRFDDAVVHKASFIVDIHNPTGSAQAEGVPEEVTPYDIPLRCLIPKRIDGLVLSGRCISGTHRAHASYRVMSICMAIGEASGVAAALAAKKGINPRDVGYKEVQKVLLDRGIDLFG